MMAWLLIGGLIGYAVGVSHWWLLATVAAAVLGYVAGAANAAREMQSKRAAIAEAVKRQAPKATEAAPKAPEKPAKKKPLRVVPDWVEPWPGAAAAEVMAAEK